MILLPITSGLRTFQASSMNSIDPVLLFIPSLIRFPLMALHGMNGLPVDHGYGSGARMGLLADRSVLPLKLIPQQVCLPVSALSVMNLMPILFLMILPVVLPFLLNGIRII